MDNYNIYIEELGKGQYQVWWDNKLIISRTTDPEYTACRYLHKLGLDGVVVSHWKGSDTPCMRLKISKCAPYTVVEENRDGLRLVKYR